MPIIRGFIVWDTDLQKTNQIVGYHLKVRIQRDEFLTVWTVAVLPSQKTFQNQQVIENWTPNLCFQRQLSMFLLYLGLFFLDLDELLAKDIALLFKFRHRCAACLKTWNTMSTSFGQHFMLIRIRKPYGRLFCEFFSSKLKHLLQSTPVFQ